MIRFLLINGFIGIFTIVLCLWGIIISIFDSSGGSLVHRYCSVPWAKTVLWVCGVKIRVIGLENVDGKSPRIYASNHQSYFDIFHSARGTSCGFQVHLKTGIDENPAPGIGDEKGRFTSVLTEKTFERP